MQGTLAGQRDVRGGKWISHLVCFHSVVKYSFDIYATSEVEARYTTQYPVLYAFVAVFIFSASSLVFLVYDFTVQRRQKKVLQSAENANAIVSSIFPANVQERILKNAEEQAKKNMKEQKGPMHGVKRQLRKFVDDDLSEVAEEEGLVTAFSTKPIADLFTACTVMFADISGFTAWSSVREPSQVFTLLETVYAAFDKVAKSLKVFKVETIGKGKNAGVSMKPTSAHRLFTRMLLRFGTGDCYVGRLL
jgi:Adenylate and Guanylate cyclase catalytic domain